MKQRDATNIDLHMFPASSKLGDTTLHTLVVKSKCTTTEGQSTKQFYQPIVLCFMYMRHVWKDTILIDLLIVFSFCVCVSAVSMYENVRTYEEYLRKICISMSYKMHEKEGMFFLFYLSSTRFLFSFCLIRLNFWHFIRSSNLCIFLSLCYSIDRC